MRVVGATVSSRTLEQLPLHKILLALNYPELTDRNKAAFIISSIAAHDVTTHKQIIMESGGTLINLLKLKQPNNHEFAYKILKTMSHKNYSYH